MNQPRRLLFLVNSLRLGGTERNVAMICKHIDQSRWRPEIWTLLDGGDYLATVTASGVPVRCLHRPWAYDPRFVIRTARQIARHPCDVIHNFSHATAPQAALAKSLFGCKRPMVYSEGTSVCNPGIRGAIDRWSIRKFSSYIANSSASHSKLVDLLGISSHNVRIVPNGHDPDRFATANHLVVRQELGISIDQPLFLFVGRLIASKRIPDFLEAMHTLRDELQSPLALIAGDGPLRETLQQEIESRGLQQNVRLLGQRRDIPELMAAADLFVFPSEVEGLPNVIIEAALAELPLVACDIAGVRDIVGDEAILVPCRSPRQIAAAVRSVLAQPEQMKQRARTLRGRVAKRFAMSHVLERLYEIYEDLLHV